MRCKNCLGPVSYHPHDCVYLHEDHSRGNGYYCSEGARSGPHADPEMFPCHCCGVERNTSPGRECHACEYGRRVRQNTPDAIRAAIFGSVSGRD